MSEYVRIKYADWLRLMEAINATKKLADSISPMTQDDIIIPPPAPEPELIRIPWGQYAIDKHGKEFMGGVLWIQAEIGLRAELLTPCMYFESKIDHKARNPYSSASGLIQFMSYTAENLGTSINYIRSLDALGQLTWVYYYFKDFADRGYDLSQWDLADTYMAILWPAGIGKPMDHAIFTEGKGNAYAVNRGLDANKDGFVTKGEAARRVLQDAEDGLINGRDCKYNPKTLTLA